MSLKELLTELGKLGVVFIAVGLFLFFFGIALTWIAYAVDYFALLPHTLLR